VFSGGTYEEGGRWLWNFLTSHAKRENPRAEVILDAREEREGRSYGVRFRLGSRLSLVWEFAYREVAEKRGNLAWCRELADRARAQVRELAAPAGAVTGRSE
jgi:hypothetical protein